MFDENTRCFFLPYSLPPSFLPFFLPSLLIIYSCPPLRRSQCHPQEWKLSHRSHDDIIGAVTEHLFYQGLRLCALEDLCFRNLQNIYTTSSKEHEAQEHCLSDARWSVYFCPLEWMDGWMNKSSWYPVVCRSSSYLAPSSEADDESFIC